jgi:hypothetical protein
MDMGRTMTNCHRQLPRVGRRREMGRRVQAASRKGRLSLEDLRSCKALGPHEPRTLRSVGRLFQQRDTTFESARHQHLIA